MNETEIVDFTREAIMLVVQISAPVMLIGLVVGLIVSLFQALTQIQEMTLAYVPKMLVVFLAIFVLFPHMGSLLQVFMERIADKIVAIG